MTSLQVIARRCEGLFSTWHLNSSEENAVIIERVLAGEGGAARTAVVLNAAAAILVADLANDWAEAIEAAERSIESGRARDALGALREASNVPGRA